MPRRPRSVLCLALLCTALLLLPGCTTQMLWGKDPWCDDDAPYGHAPMWQRLLLTPFAVAWDCVTLPAQLVFRSLTDDDDISIGGRKKDRGEDPGRINTPGTKVISH